MDNKNPRYSYNPMGYRGIRSYRPNAQPKPELLTTGTMQDEFITTHPVNNKANRAYLRLIQRLNPERYARLVKHGERFDKETQSIVPREPMPTYQLMRAIKRNRLPDHVHKRRMLHKTLTRVLPNV